nr:RNA-directed DNA polymerase, eukaryota, reverse transcriptase zinc-binding domain protein [Tanacetum cinerariifolium]GEX61175.1 RNA-directed DNA polymerase, eukaryota, reverse transcriptase zinc-binding domain protein [Tanacetum cinerariifolium]
MIYTGLRKGFSPSVHPVAYPDIDTIVIITPPTFNKARSSHRRVTTFDVFTSIDDRRGDSNTLMFRLRGLEKRKKRKECLQEKGFGKLVEETWKKSDLVEPNSIIKLKKKLQALKFSVKQWLSNDKQKSNAAKHYIQNRLTVLDTDIDQRRCTEEMVNERSNLLKELQDLNSITSLDMAQKAKIRWAIEGDENSKFFHGIINKKRSQLAIRGVRVEATQSLTFKSPFPKRLSSNQNEDLEINVFYDEIKRAVWDCGTSKSPGPDGFAFEFYRRYWKLIDQDVVVAVNLFFYSSSFLPGCNSSFIVLIPKTQDAKVVKDFRPFSLIGSVYKIIITILANRLSLVISDLVSDFQSAFVSNRQILDGPFILNELLSWIEAGRPLSPFLFILIMKSLHFSFNNVVHAGLYNGIHIDDSLSLSHLFYANDVVFLGKWSLSNLSTIVKVLKWFYLASGLKINLYKSKLMGIGISHNVVVLAARSIGCSTFHTPFTYVGVKVGDGPSLWSRFIIAIHGVRGALDNPLAFSKRSHWLDIVREFRTLSNNGIDLLSLVKKKVGNGVSTSFWDNVWLVDSPLKQVYPRLYLLEADKHSSVAAKLSDPTLSTSFRRPL